MDDHVGKPFRKADLAAAVARHLPSLPGSRGEAQVPPDFDRGSTAFGALAGRDTMLVLTANLREDLAMRFVTEPRDVEPWRRGAHATAAGTHVPGFPGLFAVCRALRGGGGRLRAGEARPGAGAGAHGREHRRDAASAPFARRERLKGSAAPSGARG